MVDAMITLTTDFGTASPYVSAMKGVILSINPRARILDLSHEIPPQDIRHAAFFLAAALPYFPEWAIHVVVVDPGVGTARALLYIEVNARRLLVPDNGCWTELAECSKTKPTVIRLTEQAFWREPVSDTFHGRDVLAPVAAHLSLGLNPNRLGTTASEWVDLRINPPERDGDGIVGEVVFVDHFGNLITNIHAEHMQFMPRPLRFVVGERIVDREGRTYSDAGAGAAIALISSTGRLEIAIVQGNAARSLQAHVGTRVSVMPGMKYN